VADAFTFHSSGCRTRCQPRVEVPAAATGVYIGCVWQEYQLLLEP